MQMFYHKSGDLGKDTGMNRDVFNIDLKTD